MERGKPHERETQTMVGELSPRNSTQEKGRHCLEIDDYHPSTRLLVACSTKVQNMAYRTQFLEIIKIITAMALLNGWPFCFSKSMSHGIIWS
ncbi:hypothetical protein AM500_10445 [Bacillus sp. FJAT-18017]|nr:hypothetical protein AM500_10445 [Bacillus sp. FJAT-18017]